MGKIQEKKKIKSIRFFAILFLIAAIVFSTFITVNSNVEIKEHRGFTQNVMSNVSETTITILFDEPVSGTFRILLYDANKNLLFSKDETVTEKSDKHIFKYTVSGDVNEYIIDEYSFTKISTPNLDLYSYILLVIASIICTTSFVLKCSAIISLDKFWKV